MQKANPHRGSNFDDFLLDEGLFDEVNALALKRAISEQLLDHMQSERLTKAAMAERMATSRAQLDRVLNPSATSIQLDSLVRAARALGREVHIQIRKPRANRATATGG